MTSATIDVTRYDLSNPTAAATAITYNGLVLKKPIAVSNKLFNAPVKIQSIVELSTQSALRIKRHLHLNDDNSQDEEIQLRTERRELKRTKRIARRLPTNAHYDPAPTPTIAVTNTPASKRQRKKDDSVRAAERAERKRQKLLPLLSDVNPAENREEIPKQDLTNSSSDLTCNPNSDASVPASNSASSISKELTNEWQKEVARPEWMSFQSATLVESDKRALVSTFELDENILSALRELNINQFFAVQSVVISSLLFARFTHDICICSPTGSGKTLAYVIPIVQSLSNRILMRLRAVVLLPSRDLAIQVASVFSRLCNALNLQIECAVGQSSFESEQRRLVETSFDVCTGLPTYNSKCDVLVCTPGRLIDHIHQTPGFSLDHVTYFVCDEADKLMTEQYDDWALSLSKILPSSRTLDSSHCGIVQNKCCKILVSATLSANPSKLASLSLHNPVLFCEVRPDVPINRPNEESKSVPIIGDKSRDDKSLVSLPPGLRTFQINCTSEEKPIFLLHLLYTLQLKESYNPNSIQNENFAQVLIFTSSIATCHRLHILIRLYGGIRCGEYSSLQSQSDRSNVIRQFKLKSVSVLVCSDAIGRGIDIDSVSHVINYDAPNHLQTYVHRVGRTARAGQTGTAITLVLPSQSKRFRSLLKRLQGETEEMTIDQSQLLISESRFKECLENLKERVKLEQQGEVVSTKQIFTLEIER